MLLSDAGLMERRPRKLQGAGFLILHRSSRELQAAASLFSTKRADINLLELEAVHIAMGLLMAVRAREAEDVAKLCQNGFSHPELRTLKAKVAGCQSETFP